MVEWNAVTWWLLSTICSVLLAQSGLKTALLGPVLQWILPLMLHLPSSSHQQGEWVAFRCASLCSQILMKMMLHSEEMNYHRHLANCHLAVRRGLLATAWVFSGNTLHFLQQERLALCSRGQQIQNISAGGSFVFHDLVHAYATQHCGFQHGRHFLLPDPRPKLHWKLN